MDREKVVHFNRLVELAVSEKRMGYGSQSLMPDDLRLILNGKSR